jgi:hypothetical protein
MATASSMILHSLRLLGEKPVGGTLTNNEQVDYLADLNSMLESWSLDGLLIYQLLQESLALTVSVGSYTIGTGGAFNTTRPNKIVDPCFTRDASSIDREIRIVDAPTYGRIGNKTLDGGYPRYMFYDSAWSAGLGTINLYPEPIAGLTLYINSWKQLQSFSSISTTLSLPPGYQRAIEYNFAIEAAGGFISVPPEVAKVALESKAAIERVNSKPPVLRMDVGIVAGHGRYDIRTG